MAALAGETAAAARSSSANSVDISDHFSMPYFVDSQKEKRKKYGEKRMDGPEKWCRSREKGKREAKGQRRSWKRTTINE